MSTTVIQEPIQIANGNYSPSQASDVINAIIDQKVNFYKVLRWSALVGDENNDIEWIEEKILSLRANKIKLQQIVNEARVSGKNLSLSGAFEITIEG